MLKCKNPVPACGPVRFICNAQQRSKTSRTGKRAFQLAGSAIESSLDLDLIFLFSYSLPGAKITQIKEFTPRAWARAKAEEQVVALGRLRFLKTYGVSGRTASTR
jgi:hypothetical protein